ncbi:methylated-DNA--[protein]-cysteine S-methyltransferase [Myroides albus]|uniref:methylated-DNA--[protein]-cysteine S-methyltransferase n=1 Tax=Myroides albus TaxID=2562892 RepID=A0A6I3LSJ0_9FLAO|nr:methylated-DNA--[protein]-cysteine S-methyltransferase [Myroides albus]MTG99062.1 methylated-DNA--[protein]-cysteine S-methyltransferase [Myroides albus]UVD79057.1 methylated-DNA--[protein]-cysteine S-methyltransferase [Myroides albus]
MQTQEHINYKRIEQAIIYLKDNFAKQPSLEQVANHVHLSPSHFQRIFDNWVGISPKKFIQYISLNHAKTLLSEPEATLFDTTYQTGLSSSSRLHDMFVNIEGMTPAEYKNAGKNLQISYAFYNSIFGSIIIASTSKGICYIAFEDDQSQAIDNLQMRFANAHYTQQETDYHKQVLGVFQNDWSQVNKIKLHLKGTDFQLKVWEALLQIPMGRLSTYGQIAKEIGNPSASRAVGTAIGSNPIALLIPCHRVIQASGIFGGYRWGPSRKTAIIGWESAKTDHL